MPTVAFDSDPAEEVIVNYEIKTLN